MAVVWRAWDTVLEREVAIKEPMVPPGIPDAAREEFMERFRRECRLAAGLNHPGIVSIYDTSVIDGRAVVVTELVEGNTLDELLASGPLATGLALAITRELLQALAYAHARGVVHRDVKPANIFVSADGRLKLADFGIACATTGSALTRIGGVLGSPGYMSPEQIRGARVDARADVFATGVLLHEMLAGVNPFDAGNPVATMDRTLRTPIPMLSRADIPPNINDVIAIASAKDPAQRYQSADAMLSALNGAAVATSIPAMAAPLSAIAPVASAPAGSQTTKTVLWVGGVLAVVALAIVLMAGGTGSTGGSVAPTTTGAGTGVVETAAVEPTDTTADTPPTIDELKADLSSSLYSVFEAAGDGDYDPITVEDLHVAQDNAGTYWGFGVAKVPNGWVDIGIMKRTGDVWTQYRLLSSSSSEWIWDPTTSGVPSEAQDALFATISEYQVGD